MCVILIAIEMCTKPIHCFSCYLASLVTWITICNTGLILLYNKALGTYSVDRTDWCSIIDFQKCITVSGFCISGHNLLMICDVNQYIEILQHS